MRAHLCTCLRDRRRQHGFHARLARIEIRCESLNFNTSRWGGSKAREHKLNQEMRRDKTAGMHGHLLSGQLGLGSASRQHPWAWFSWTFVFQMVALEKKQQMRNDCLNLGERRDAAKHPQGRTGHEASGAPVPPPPSCSTLWHLTTFPPPRGTGLIPARPRLSDTSNTDSSCSSTLTTPPSRSA